MWEAFARGQLVDLRVGDAMQDDPAAGDAWGDERTVRAEVLATLLFGDRAAEPGRVSALRLAGARIDGEIDLEYGEVPYRIRLTGCHIPQAIKLYNVRARHVAIEECDLARVYAANSVIDGALRISGCRVKGQVILDGAHVAGVLDLNGTQVSNPDGVALAANRIEVGDHVWMSEGFMARGEVSLRAARIGGDIDLTGARLSNPGRIALVASRMRLEGGVLGEDLGVDGQVRLRGTVIAGDAFLGGARLNNPGDIALHGYRLHVGGGMNLDSSVIRGGVNLAVAEISALLLRGATITSPDVVALDMWQARIRQLQMRTADPVEGLVDVRHAEIGVLHDTADTWPAGLRLDGLHYERLVTPLSAKERLRWLSRDADGYLPQPYEYLAQAYRALGHENEARAVLLAKERQRHRALPWYARLWGVVQDVTVGYGYRPARAGLWLIALLVTGSIVFATHPPVRTSSTGTQVFNPVIFTLDHLLPIIGFGQAGAFTPTSGTQWVGYGLTAAGWILATTIATGVTRSVNRL